MKVNENVKCSNANSLEVIPSTKVINHILPKITSYNIPALSASMINKLKDITSYYINQNEH